MTKTSQAQGFRCYLAVWSVAISDQAHLRYPRRAIKHLTAQDGLTGQSKQEADPQEEEHV